MPSLVPWLRAAIIGPCLSVTSLVTVLTLLGRVGEAQSRFWLWLTSMAYGGVLATLCASTLLLADWTLFKAEQRKLPTGRRAWWVSAAMPIALAAFYQLLEPGDEFGPIWFAAMIIPAVVLAGVLRFTFNEPYR